jgi:hypothetical protein
MATRNGLQERIRAALRTDAEFYRGLAELQAADHHLRSLADQYVGKHDVGQHGVREHALEETPAAAPPLLPSPTEVRLTAELARQVDESRSLAVRLKRCRRWLIAVSITLAIVAAGAGVLGYLEITRN